MINQCIKCQNCNNDKNYDGVCLADECVMNNKLNCYDCLLTDHINHANKVVPLSQIMKNNQLFITNWPQEKFAKEFQYYIDSNNPDQLIQQVEQLFVQFQDNVISQINICKKELKAKIQQQLGYINKDQYNNIHNKLLRAFDLSPVRQCIENLFQQKLDLNNCNQQLTEFIKNEKRKNEIIDLDKQFSEILKQPNFILNMNSLKLRQNQIILDISKINSCIFQNNISQLLLNSDFQLIDSWLGCDQNKNLQYELLYSGQKDGFDSSTFHQKCDNKSPTLVIIKAHTGKRFGGFTNLTWNHTGSHKANDPEAFIYSIDLQKKFNCTNQKYVIFCDKSYGPCFGGGCDILIFNQGNLNESCQMNFKHSYGNNQNEIQDYKKILGREDSSLFKVLDIEVFLIKKQN